MDAGFQDRCNRPLCHLSGAMRAVSYSPESGVASCGVDFCDVLFAMIDLRQPRRFSLSATPVRCPLQLTVADQDGMGIPLAPIAIAEFFHIIAKVVV